MPQKPLQRPNDLPPTVIKTHSLYTFSASTAFIVSAFAAMTYFTWDGWPDILIDFGRELYIPWQLSLGKHLYTDIAYYSGPLSPHINALWFTLFGVGMKTLVIANLVILAAFCILLFKVLHTLSDNLTATVAMLVFVLVIAFGQYTAIGNYNYVCPYSHDAVHGLVLAVASMAAAMKAATTRRVAYSSISGLCLGLCFLTRGEVFIAAIAGILILHVGMLVGEQRIAWRRIAVFAISAICPPLLSLLLLSTHMPLSDALIGTLGTWPATLNRDVVAMPFFRYTMGTDNTAASLRLIAAYLAAIGILLALPTVISLLLKRRTKPNVALLVSFTAVPAIGLSIYWQHLSPADWLRPLPVIATLCTVAFARAAWQSRKNSAEYSVATHRLAWCLFSLVLLGKTLLRSQLFHYGFYLAVPAVMTLILACLSWLPNTITRRGAEERLLRAAVLGILFAFTLTHIQHTRDLYQHKTSMIHAGPDSFRTDWRGPLVAEAVNTIQSMGRPTDTLVCIPEGVMLNYLLRLTNPTPHTNFMPTEMAIFGEAQILETLKTHPPDWIALVHKDTSEFGSQYFGRDYGRDYKTWIQSNYEVASLIGKPPLEADQFGIALLRRKTPQATGQN